MAAAGIMLVPTLAVFPSVDTFASTMSIPRFTDPAFAVRMTERRERAEAGVLLAYSRGVPIAVGSDFGGGLRRANQLS